MIIKLKIAIIFIEKNKLSYNFISNLLNLILKLINQNIYIKLNKIIKKFNE